MFSGEICLPLNAIMGLAKRTGKRILANTYMHTKTHRIMHNIIHTYSYMHTQREYERGEADIMIVIVIGISMFRPWCQYKSAKIMFKKCLFKKCLVKIKQNWLPVFKMTYSEENKYFAIIMNGINFMVCAPLSEMALRYDTAIVCI